MAVESPDQYCRAIEAYLCRKNDGHLIRIVGPAFEQVLGWAARGVPIAIACHGIDRYFERYYAKGPRRRPVRIEFCEADVLDAFDEWRRAVGISAVARSAASERSEPSGDAPRRQGSLPAHLDRVIARLTAVRAGAGADPEMDAALDGVIRELDGRRSDARAVRGDARRELLDRLRVLDAHLLAAARRHCDADTLARVEGEAEDELAPFKDRLSIAAWQDARRAAIDRLIRARARLPAIAFD